MIMHRLVNDRSIRLAFFAVFALVVTAGAASAQEYAVAQGDAGAPRFLFAASRGETPVPVDAGSIPSLGRRIDLNLSDVTIDDALRAIESTSRLQLVYSAQVVPVTKRVSVKASGITVAAALTEVLFKANVDVLLSGGRIVMVRGPKPLQVGTVTGRVIDASTQQGVPGVRVSLEGTRWGTTTGSTGSYRMAGVAAGAYTLVTRRLGYKGFEQAVVVEDDREVTLDVTLQPVPSALSEVVVTATGEQRLMELGHVVGRINADSLVREAPVANLSDLLTARVPGVQVAQVNGAVGGRVKVQVRGLNSALLNNQPIVIVDGVRYTNDERPRLFGSGPGDTDPSSPLNDINVNEIESVEVVKGPSAATLYGTDAANGVIVITTKRGQPGPARWNSYAKGTVSSIPERFPDFFWGWGTVFGEPDNTTASCLLSGLAEGWCTQQDSVTVLPNPLNDPEYSILGSAPTWEYGASVAGGREDLRYRFSGDFQDATGPIRMPPAVVAQVQTRRGLRELPEEWLRPNALTKLNLRSNLTADLSERADLRLNVGYIRTDTRTLPRFLDPYTQAFYAVNPQSPYGFFDPSGPAEAYAQTASEKTDRFLGNASGRWRPAPWLEMRGTVGLDLTTNHRYGLVRPGDQPNFQSNGAVEDSRSRQVATTAELSAAATARRGRLSTRTALGGQYVRTLATGSGVLGRGLPPGGSVPQSALSIQTSQTHLETVVLGGYLEEMLGVNDRLFLTGAVRLDGASAFGRDFDVAVYPKVGASWLVSEEPFLPRLTGLDHLRLRYAYGASGKQPHPAWARPGLEPGQAWLNGGPVNAVILNGLGNPELGPERVREHEFGFDVGAVGSRVTLDATWFRRRTAGMIVSEPGPVGSGVLFRNLGLVTQRGFEAQVHARVLDGAAVSWDLALQHSDYATRIDDIGNGAPRRSDRGGYAEGYPLGGRFRRPVVGFDDANGDGIIAFSEIQRGDSAVYMGQSIPPRSQTFSTVLGLFQRRLRLSALVERKTGFTQINDMQCLGTCRAVVDPSTPLEEQAKAVHAQSNGAVPEKGDFTRLREVTTALDLPMALTRAMRLRAATVSVSARNLALWTGFSGPDPEAGNPNFFSNLWNAAGGSAAGIPQSRTYSVRLDVGF
jgi:TonB-linked SusC/RagA family outer membrane protein